MKNEEKDLGADAAVVDSARSAEASDAAPHDAKHTPGPWRTGVDVENCGGGMNVMTADDSLRVAHTARFVRGGEVLISESVAKANAHLIAAAPEMLEALKVIGDMFDCRQIVSGVDPEIDQRNTAIAMQMARSAIAKAEGRS